MADALLVEYTRTGGNEKPALPKAFQGPVSVSYLSKECQLCTYVRYRNRPQGPISVTYKIKWADLRNILK